MTTYQMALGHGVPIPTYPRAHRVATIHAHRKAAETKAPTYEDYLDDPASVLEQVEREARRVRAQTVHQIIVAPLMQLFKRVPNLRSSTA